MKIAAAINNVQAMHDPAPLPELLTERVQSKVGGRNADIVNVSGGPA